MSDIVVGGRRFVAAVSFDGMYRVFRIYLAILIPVITQLMRLACIMVGSPKKLKGLKYAILKISFSFKCADHFENSLFA